jgi:hypothetical protein
MNVDIFDRVRRELEDPLRRILGAFCIAIGGGAGVWFTRGDLLRVGLGIVCALALSIILVTLVKSGRWQSRELEENAYRKARDLDARQRKSLRFEREVTKLLIDARENTLDPASMTARLDGMLEKLRVVLTQGSKEPINLLVIKVCPDPEPCRVAYSAGRFDSSVIRNPGGSVEDLINDLVGDDEGAGSYWGHFRVDGEPYRLVALSSGEITEWGKTEVHRATTVFMSLAQTLSDRRAHDIRATIEGS